jgi:hypothetical protein
MGCIASVLPPVQSHRQLHSVSLRIRSFAALWHDVPVPDESHSEQLRRESTQLLATAAKLIEHAETLKAQPAELQKQIARLDRPVKPKKA